MTETSITRINHDLFAKREAFALPERGRGHKLRKRVQPESAPQADAPIATPAPTARIASAETSTPPKARPRPAKPAPKQEPRFSIRKRVAVLVAAIAVPAMAAPGDFGAEPGAAPTEAQALLGKISVEEAMPFERPGMSFPGSAFYYLGDPPSNALVALPTADPLDVGAEEGRELGQMIDAGPAASAFVSAGTGMSKARAQRCLAQAIYYEAASESVAGQRAVAQVVLNRVAHSAWPGSICGVVYEGSTRSTGCQFSFTCDGSLARKAGGVSWARAQRIAADALAGEIYTPIGLATHYHTLWVNPYWAGTLDHVGTIGAHRFYKNRGAAGRKSAFTGGYRGFEPSVRGRTARAPGARTDAPSAGRNDPLTSPAAPALEGNRSGAATNAASPRAADADAPTAAPLANPDTKPGLRNSGQVKERYSNAGQWKRKPENLEQSTQPE